MASKNSKATVGTERNVDTERSALKRCIDDEPKSDDCYGGRPRGNDLCPFRYREHRQHSEVPENGDEDGIMAPDFKRRRYTENFEDRITIVTNETCNFKMEPIDSVYHSDSGSDNESGESTNSGSDDDDSGSESDRNGDSNDDDSVSNDGHTGGRCVIANDVPAEVKICHSTVDEGYAESDNHMIMEVCNNDDIQILSEKESYDDDSEDIDDDSDNEDIFTDASYYCSHHYEELNGAALPKKTPKKMSFSVPLPHEFFLPENTSPTFEDLKYDSEDDDDISDNDDDGHEALYMMPPYLSTQTYMTAARGQTLCRPWRDSNRSHPHSLQPLSSSLSLVTDSSSLGSDPSYPSSSNSSKLCNTIKRAGVFFSEKVTVYPIFEKSTYSPSMVKSIYTKRDELRVNKLRNKKEYAYEDHDWKEVVEEEDMERDPKTGGLIHPAHSYSPFVSTNDAILSSYQIGSVVVTRAKKMRMWY